jgi:hypothetical protein
MRVGFVLCSDVELTCSVWRRYDALATGSDTSSASSVHVLTLLISAHKNLVTHVLPARHLCVDGRSGGTCKRLSIALSWPPQLGQRHGDGGDGCQRDGVERRWDDWHRGSLEGAKCSDESAMVRLPNRCSANVLPTFSLHRFFPISIDQHDRADAPHPRGVHTIVFGGIEIGPRD